jgi:pimeloyl-ACP methyl ester carboxylesterase
VSTVTSYDSHPNSRTTELPGTPVTYLDLGDGPPIVIVHGLNAYAHDWLAVGADLVERGRRALIPYRRGRAPSGPLGADYTVGTEVQDLRALLRVAGPGVALVGHSYGGLIALLTAREHPDLGALVLYEPPLPNPRSGRNAALVKIRAALDAGDPETAIATIITDIDGDPPSRVDAVRAGPHWSPLVALAETAYGELSAVDDFAEAGGVDLTRYRDVEVPTTVLLGEHTEPGFGPAARAIVAAVPAAELRLLPGQGHLAHVEASRTLAGVIEAATRRRPR